MSKLKNQKIIDNYQKFKIEIFNIIKKKRVNINSKLIINKNINTIKKIERELI